MADRAADNIERFLHLTCVEPLRLKGLTDGELIHECLDNGLSSNPHVEELMRRVDPGWLDRYDDEGNPKTEANLPPFGKNGTNSMEFAWVIERDTSAPSAPEYFTGRLHPALWWSNPGEHEDALRFARKQDAEKFTLSLDCARQHRVCEHGWDDK